MRQPGKRWFSVVVLTLGCFVLIYQCAATGKEPTILYQEDFSNPDGAVWTIFNSPDVKGWIGDGRYNILINRCDYQVFGVANGREFESFRLDVDTLVAACPADNEYGVLFRVADGGNCYGFLISACGYIRLLKRLDGHWVTVIPHKRCYTINLGQAANHLTVVAKGCRLSCYVNNGKVLEVTDYSLANGRIALVAGVHRYPGFQVAFDNVTLHALPE